MKKYIKFHYLNNNNFAHNDWYSHFFQGVICTAVANMFDEYTGSELTQYLKTLRPERSGHHFADNILELKFLRKKYDILLLNSTKWFIWQ